MIDTLAKLYLATEMICIILLLELIATGKSFGGLFLIIFGITYVVNRRIL